MRSNNLAVNHSSKIFLSRSNPRWWTRSMDGTAMWREPETACFWKNELPEISFHGLLLHYIFLVPLLQLSLTRKFLKSKQRCLPKDQFTCCCSAPPGPVAHYLAQPYSWADSSLHENIFKWSIFRLWCYKRRRTDKDLSLIPHHLSTLHHPFTFLETAKAQWLKAPGFWMPG